jgi:maltooligosyltrehalose trehalohydrolase
MVIAVHPFAADLHIREIRFMRDKIHRRYPVGAELTEGGVSFRVWAPGRESVAVSLHGEERSVALEPDGDGYFAAFVAGVAAGALYSFRLDDDPLLYPDPASRYQPQGVHGPSEVVDPTTYQWQDRDWKGLTLPGQVIYEVHIGCFTTEGTWNAAEAKLPYLVETGVTLLQVMPVAEFYGDFGWGYDGVKWYSPTRNYGTPDDMRRFIDAAHGLGLGVILDVVYNHFGPTGNYAGAFTRNYFSERHPTEWGDAINYDGRGANGVRSHVVNNAAYWIDEFHLDGLRLDATQAIFDDSPRHILADLSTAARAAARGRSIVIVAENEPQEIRHVEPIEAGGFGLDGVLNDDFHHACRVAATGHAEFYYADYEGTPQELMASTIGGYLYQGQYAPHAKKYRGTPARHVPTWRFIHCLQNHDQVANSALGLRWSQLTSPGRSRALTTLWLLGPATPMLFMGQEFAARAPFLYFADHEPHLAPLVREGRWNYLRNFARVTGFEGAGAMLHDPSDRKTFEESRIDWKDLETNAADWRLHRDLLRLRRYDPVFARQDRRQLSGSVVHPECLLLRWHDEHQDDRLLLVNLGRDFPWKPAADPLLAPPLNSRWTLTLSSDAMIYGGSGTAALDPENWHIPGHCALLLSPQNVDGPPVEAAAPLA